MPFVRPGGEILLRVAGKPKVKQVLRHIDGVEEAGIGLRGCARSLAAACQQQAELK
ncbi:hypothetical protein AA0242T_1248 [Acetobacter aceti NRIC 0242]|uniref:Uncharacterized protein n=1 Tax=Acetobacter aceti NBRC 14818 TaxID=887700 RepID=A0AB33IHP1_ACEAC|nr:uncharacterized protein DUF2840 [Acetobacter aceti NBRC 14818]BCK76336.1 hypothetical protein EMQ_1942 [Acetobacter aceti NBRC 14818]GAN58909.1 hypothetical protein Abac_107_018 [Acetobacter aceti NBRC 14818]GBO80546.1 hypothetical protein AA0242T_1248 [Acetobacter aceti NRIC 0242]